MPKGPIDAPDLPNIFCDLDAESRFGERFLGDAERLGDGEGDRRFGERFLGDAERFLGDGEGDRRLGE